MHDIGNVINRKHHAEYGALLANDILKGKEGAVERYLEFLSLGSTKDPVESLKVAGVDIEDDKIYDEVFEVFEDKLKKLRSLYE